MALVRDALVGGPTTLALQPGLLTRGLLGLVALLLLSLWDLLLSHLGLLACLGLLDRLLGLSPAELLLWLSPDLLLLGLLPELLLLGVLLGLLALLTLLSLLAARRQELACLRVTRPLLGQLAHPLAELRGVALVHRSMVGASALLTGEARLLAGRLLLGGDVPLLLLGLLAHLSLLLLTILSLPWILLTHGCLPGKDRTPDRAVPDVEYVHCRVTRPTRKVIRSVAGCNATQLELNHVLPSR